MKKCNIDINENVENLDFNPKTPKLNGFSNVKCYFKIS